MRPCRQRPTASCALRRCCTAPPRSTSCSTAPEATPEPRPAATRARRLPAAAPARRAAPARPRAGRRPTAALRAWPAACSGLGVRRLEPRPAPELRVAREQRPAPPQAQPRAGHRPSSSPPVRTLPPLVRLVRGRRSSTCSAVVRVAALHLRARRHRALRLLRQPAPSASIGRSRRGRPARRQQLLQPRHLRLELELHVRDAASISASFWRRARRPPGRRERRTMRRACRPAARTRRTAAATRPSSPPACAPRFESTPPPSTTAADRGGGRRPGQPLVKIVSPRSDPLVKLARGHPALEIPALGGYLSRRPAPPRDRLAAEPARPRAAPPPTRPPAPNAGCRPAAATERRQVAGALRLGGQQLLGAAAGNAHPQ